VVRALSTKGQAKSKGLLRRFIQSFVLKGLDPISSATKRDAFACVPLVFILLYPGQFHLVLRLELLPQLRLHLLLLVRQPRPLSPNAG
jgi:hypothetical protein